MLSSNLLSSSGIGCNLVGTAGIELPVPCDTAGPAFPKLLPCTGTASAANAKGTGAKSSCLVAPDALDLGRDRLPRSNRWLPTSPSDTDSEPVLRPLCIIRGTCCDIFIRVAATSLTEPVRVAKPLCMVSTFSLIGAM